MTLSGDKKDFMDGPALLVATGEESSPLIPGISLVDANASSHSIWGGELLEISKLLKNSGVYALSAVITPLLTLALAPFLTRTLTPTDYGILTLLNTLLSLLCGITQVGLGSAFFRAYSYDYVEERDKHDVVATVTMMLFLISLLALIIVIMLAPFSAELLFGHKSFSGLIAIMGGVLFVENLTIPGLSWLRAENRALLYSLLAMGNVLMTLIATVALVGILHQGVAGALIAIGIGQCSVAVCTIPVILYRVGTRMRVDVVRNLLGFGVPLVFGFVSYWILQLSDRYLLSRFASLAEAAKYAVAYTLGSALAAVIIGPFSLAWPSTMFAIAKGKEAAKTFQLVFRWFGLFLLFMAFCLSFIGVFALHLLFSPIYYVVAPVIPIIATSIVFYGIYHIFMVGPNIKRQPWVNGVCTTSAAIVNLLLNLVLIPRYGALGAALSTLIAYVALAVVAYHINQRMYPVAFELERFGCALFIGVVIYAGSSVLAQHQNMKAMCVIYVVALVLYGICLAMLGKIPCWSLYRLLRRGGLKLVSRSDETVAKAFSAPTKICMHVLGPARPDVRVMREATALARCGYSVSVVDVESEMELPIEEKVQDVCLKHIFVSERFLSTRFARWTIIRAGLILVRSILRLLQARADIYHAHDISGLLPCYIAARIRRKPLIFDAHELPLVGVMSIRSQWIFALLTYVVKRIVPYCVGIITVSPPIGEEIHERYPGPEVSLIRNMPSYKAISKNDRLRQYLALSLTTRIALYQGYIMENRGLDLLVMAAKHLQPDIVIVIMGKDVNGLQSQLEALAIREGVTDRVKIIPPVPYIDLLNWTASADLGLTVFRPDYSLSIKMCLPNKLFEYLMAGLPILTSPLEAIVDVINKYDVGRVVHSLAPKDIGEAINAMFADDSAYERMQRNALEAARKDLCWEQEEQQLLRLYQRALLKKEDVDHRAALQQHVL